MQEKIEADYSVLHKSERNYGIDLLKIFSMILICILHILGQGGILRNLSRFTWEYNVAWLLETAAFCCVNCYALVTGFVQYGRKFKYSNIVNLYLTASFYILVFTVIFSFKDPGSVEPSDYLNVLFPFAYNDYWYFTAYFCMFFFIPYLNIIIEKLNKSQGAKLLMVIFILFSVLPIAFNKDIFKTSNGYSAFWLALLYLAGAYFKKYNIPSLVKKRTALIFYICSIVLAWGIRLIFLQFKSEHIWIKATGSLIVNYCSPFIIIASVALLLLFSNFKFKEPIKKVIKFFVPLSFSVYLIHVNPFVWKELVKDAFVPFTNYSIPMMVFYIIASAVAVWFICSMIDLVRFYIFNFLKINKLGALFEKLLRKVFNKLASLVPDNT